MPTIVFIFIPSITSIAFSLITKNEGEGIKSHGGHSEESKVIREFGHEKKNTLNRFHFHPCNYFDYE